MVARAVDTHKSARSTFTCTFDEYRRDADREVRTGFDAPEFQEHLLGSRLSARGTAQLRIDTKNEKDIVEGLELFVLTSRNCARVVSVFMGSEKENRGWGLWVFSILCRNISIQVKEAGGGVPLTRSDSGRERHTSVRDIRKTASKCSHSCEFAYCSAMRF